MVSEISVSSALPRIPEPRAIVGTVVELGTDERLGRANVWVEALGGQKIGGLTNVQGRFLLLNVPQGVHTLRIELVGYVSHSQEVRVTGERSAAFRIALTKIEPTR